MFNTLKKRFTSGAAQTKTELSSQDIIRGFHELSHSLQILYPRIVSRSPIEIVVAGGACSIMELKNLCTTDEVDVYNPNAKIMDVIHQAKYHSFKEFKNYSPGWINTEMVAYSLNHQGLEDLFQSSVNQGVVLFQSPSLKVYAADWRYQLAFKISRAFDKKEEIKHMSEISEQERVDRWNTEVNMLDAVALLRRLIDLKGHALKISEIEKWFYFGTTFTKRAVDSINKDFSWAYQTHNLPIIYD